MLKRAVFSLVAAGSLVACSPGQSSSNGSTSEPAPTVIRLGNGQEVRLDNDSREGDEYVRHEDLGVLPVLGYHLVRRTYYEGGEYVLIHPTTGRQTVLPDSPHVAPGGDRLVVASMDFEAGYTPNLLQVWQVTPDSLALEWEQETGGYAPANGWGASDPVWVNDSTLELTRNEPDAQGSIVRTSRVRMMAGPDGWRFAPPYP